MNRNEYNCVFRHFQLGCRVFLSSATAHKSFLFALIRRVGVFVVTDLGTQQMGRGCCCTLRNTDCEPVCACEFLRLCEYVYNCVTAWVCLMWTVRCSVISFRHISITRVAILGKKESVRKRIRIRTQYIYSSRRYRHLTFVLFYIKF